MFETLMRLYDGGNGPLTVVMLANAVIKGWISEAGKQVIMETKK
ncbi:MAG: XkdX family protein [Lacrimispora sphenoides]